MIDRRSLIGCLALAPFAAGPAFAAAPASIIATTGMVADIARRLTGATVPALMGPGMDPHGYRPTRADILALSRADVILWHGLGLEVQFEPLFADLAEKATVHAVGDALPADRLLGDPEYADRPDPHIWFDPALWAEAVRGTAPVLQSAGFDVTAGMQAYLDDIEAIAAYSRQVLDSVPENRRILVTAHDAFAYFGRAHGWRVEGIQGISTESEAGLARIEELVDLLVTAELPAVFVESSVSDRTIRALIEGAAARGHEVVIGAELFSDAMGPEGSHEGTWIGMIDHNVTAIARALGGTAPERGMTGRLSAAS